MVEVEGTNFSNDNFFAKTLQELLGDRQDAKFDRLSDHLGGAAATFD